MKIFATAIAFSALASGLFAQSQSINFGSDIAVGLTSSGSSWAADNFTFQLGLFDVGFAPSASNVNDWSSNWNLANQGGASASTVWLDDGGDLYFAGAAAITSLTAPFTPGKQLYIWGFDSVADGQNEWILLTAPSWTVAANLDTPASSNFLTTDSGVVAVIGSRSANGVETFQSVAVTIGAAIPEPSSFAAFAGLAVLGAVATRRRRSA